MIGDIEERLRLDAQRCAAAEGPPPALADMLGVAPAAPRAHGGAWVVAATVAVLVTVGGSVVVSRWLTEPESDVAANAAPPYVEGRPPHATIVGGLVTLADPSVVQLFMTYAMASEPCEVTRLDAGVTRQTSESVSVSFAGYQPAVTPKRHVGVACEPGYAASTEIHLDAPFGSRALYDAATGAGVDVLDPARVPTPSHVPNGYLGEPVSYDDVWESANGGISIGLEISPTSGGTLRLPAAVRVYEYGTRVLVIRDGQPAVVTPTARAVRDVSVDGHAAILSGAADARCVTWQASSTRSLQVCSGNNPRLSVPPGPEPPLADAALLQVARSLH